MNGNSECAREKKREKIKFYWLTTGGLLVNIKFNETTFTQV
jgi:hypothetical protein